jgi:hypothetical protein
MKSSGFYVMGYENGRVILMSASPFHSLAAAEKYRAGCAIGWEAFIVQKVSA